MRRRLRVGMRIGLALLVGLALGGEARPGVAQEGVCDSAPETRLAIGQWAVVADVVSTTPAGGLRLRETPRTTGVEVDLLPAGTLVRVVDGPACNDGFRWYYLSVQPLGLEGWSAEAIPGSYYLNVTVGPTATPAPGQTAAQPVVQPTASILTPGIVGTPVDGACPEAALPSYLRVGAAARAASQAHPVRLREAPQIASIFTGVIYQDKVIDVIAGPTCAEGLAWFQVSVDGRPGWTIEAAGGRYLLIDPANPPPQVEAMGGLSEIPPSPTPASEPLPAATPRPLTPPGVARRAVYTPDGSRLAVGAGEGVRLYETANYTLQGSLASGPVLDFVTIGGGLYAVAWAPEGIALVSVPDGAIRTVLVNAPYDPAWAVAAPDGAWLILGPTSDGATATLWDLNTARTPAIPPFWWPGWGVVRASFSPDNRYVILNDTVSLRRCEMAGPGCLFDLVRNDFLPAGIFGDITWTGDGATLGGFSDRFWLWDGDPLGVGLTLRSTLTRQEARRVALNADATRAAIASGNLLEIWDLSTYTALRVNTLPGPVSSLAYRPDGTQLAAAAGGAVSLYDPVTGLPLRQVE